MSYDFNADDVFEMAEQMERNGGKFYRTAADSTQDSANKEFLQELAAMEDAHEETFKVMRAEITAQEKASTVFDPGAKRLYIYVRWPTPVFFLRKRLMSLR